VVSLDLMIEAYDGIYRDDFLDLLRTTVAPYSRAQFEPGHITASCYIIDDNDRLLLHHHRRLDRWLQMGGHLEPDEMPVDAALREAAEESGLRDLQIVSDGILDLDIHVIPAGRGEPEHRHFDVRYIARTGSPEAIAMDDKESKALQWVGLGRAAVLMKGEESLRVLRKIARLI
jgi:8-oxo-dGTP pyrophosphatase MutT (NUDIX family)